MLKLLTMIFWLPFFFPLQKIVEIETDFFFFSFFLSLIWKSGWESKSISTFWNQCLSFIHFYILNWFWFVLYLSFFNFDGIITVENLISILIELISRTLKWLFKWWWPWSLLNLIHNLIFVFFSFWNAQIHIVFFQLIEIWINFLTRIELFALKRNSNKVIILILLIIVIIIIIIMVFFFKKKKKKQRICEWIL